MQRVFHVVAGFLIASVLACPGHASVAAAPPSGLNTHLKTASPDAKP
jgi:hypothetical protein